jgi:two-component system chemotaxis response regulator CheB
MVGKMLNADPDITVVDTAVNGKRAIDALDQHDVEVVVLDIEMPVMDGLTALPLLIKKKPGLQVVIASTLSERNAAISLKAMSMGAADYVPKPTTGRIGQSVDFQKEIIEKVKVYGGAYRKAKGGRSRGTKPATAPIAAGAPAQAERKSLLYKDKTITLRKPPNLPPQLLAIGSSTGGPQALFDLFGAMKGKIRQPILITQHMPPTFTKIFAERLGTISGIEAAEGVDGEKVVGGRIYVAPGDYHMIVEKSDGAGVIRLTQSEPVNFCRPAVDPMMRSLAEVYGGRVLGLILTGMGHDGAAGGQALIDAGGAMLTQDEETSVVWGMPGAVATAGICYAVLPLPEIADHLGKTLGVG